MKRRIGILLVTLLLITPALLAQAVIEKSTEKVRIDGTIYYLHTVKKGETIYSLAKAYNVTQEELVKKNPKLSEGLKLGDNLIIPVSNGDNTQTVNKAPSITDKPTPTKNTALKKHIVQKKETLYSISRQYHVNVNDLLSVNNLPDNAIKVGMELLIPNSETTAATGYVPPPVKEKTGVQPQETTPARYHKVKENETLESIAVTYGVTQSVLMDLNKDIFSRGKLMTGMLLELPPANLTNTPSADTRTNEPTPVYTIDCETAKLLAKGQTYKVALLLPFAGTAPSYQHEMLTDSVLNTEYSNANENYVEFYEGALLAMEDMKKQGLRAELSVFDILCKKDDVASLINRNALSQFDLIIGPIHAQDFAPVAEYAKQNHINIVSPLDSKTECLTNTNPYVFQVSPPVNYQYAKLFKDINPMHDRNVLLISEKSIFQQDSLLAKDFYDALKQQTDFVTPIVYQEETGKSLAELIKPHLKVAGDNRVVIASNNEVFVTKALAFLHQLVVLRKYQITVYGTSRWRNFESIDLTYFHELNLKIALPFFVDYNLLRTKDFIANYRTTFNAEPSQFAFQGYDVLSYFMQALMQYGKHFEGCISTFTPTLLQSNYHFSRSNMQGGFLNTEPARITYTPAFTIERD